MHKTPALGEAELFRNSGRPPEVAASEVAAVAARSRRLVVLDDDPTGTQTVAAIPVVTAWTEAEIHWAIEQETDGFYILTNTRSLDPSAAADRNRQVLAALAAVTRGRGLDVSLVSRSDSTLRGHFPLETDVLAEGYQRLFDRPVDAVALIPAYIDAGRLTVDSTHWVSTRAGYIRAGESEFAADPAFGYTSSDLRAFVAEKTDGRWSADQVERITLADLRDGGVATVAACLEGLHGGQPVVVDAATDGDLRVFALAAMAAERNGATLLYRVGPSFVRNRLGQDAHPPIDDDELATLLRAPRPAGAAPPGVGGLVVVGSYVGLSTRQLDGLLAAGGFSHHTLDVPELLRAERPDAVLARIAEQVTAELQRGDVIVSTSRRLMAGESALESLEMHARVSAGLVDVVRRVTSRTSPRWIVAKGGITSSDVATRALGIRRAWVRGTLLPGVVSLWQPVGTRSDAPYVVFAGNVGDDDSLTQVVGRLQSAA
jgi:uncharacterized protein YgbK (DUF1537 family)